MNKTPPEMIMARIIGAAFGLAFGGIGLTILVNMWFMPFGGFGSPPLFFFFFASFIAIPFVAIGAGAVYAAFTGKPMSSVSHVRHRQSEPLERAGNLQTVCPACGAPIGSAEISPSGDVKCLHCKNWFNVQNRPA